MTNKTPPNKIIEVIVKCIACGNRRDIKAGEVPKGEMPMCDKCGSIMIAEKAELKSN